MLFLTKNVIEEKRHNRGVFALINPHSEHGDSGENIRGFKDKDACSKDCLSSKAN